MLRLTLAQMRRSLGRLAAGGLAIAIGTAFVAATLIAGAVITRTSYDAFTAGMARADLVIDRIPADQLEQVLAVPGVEAADPQVHLSVELSHDNARIGATVMPVASDPRLEAQELTAGELPAGRGEIALPVDMAERLGTAVGEEILAPNVPNVPNVADVQVVPDATDAPSGQTLRVVGLLSDPHGAYADRGGMPLVSPVDALVWSGSESLADAGSGGALVALVAGADLEAVRSAIMAINADLTVMTRDEAAQELVKELSGGTNVLTTAVLGFAGIALVVAALVISNTFQVLVAQRTRTLALLRCVGAAKRQLRASVLIEATILGLVSSAIGTVIGIALSQAALLVLGTRRLDVPLPSTVTVTLASVIAPLVVGTAVTVLAALTPARAATRVAPIAALRPADAPVVTARSSRVRLVLSSVLTVGGTALLLLAALTPGLLDPTLGLLVGILGGATSFVGVLVGAVFWVPRVVSGAGGLLGRSGASARLAAANTARNPRRTAATSAALLIGVTLVALMSTGAVSARDTLGNELDDAFPVDVTVTMPHGDDGWTALSSEVRAAVDQLEDVALSVPVSVGDGAIGVPGAADASQSYLWVELVGVEPQDARNVMRTDAGATALTDDAIVMRAAVADRLGVEDGDVVPVQIFAATGEVEPDSPSADLRVVVRDFGGGAALVTPSTFELLRPGSTPNGLWARFADVTDAAAGFPRVQDALSDTPASIEGAAAERASYQRVVDVLLAIVVGLLGVAVVIALVGVANTLSLSVLERRRESATLRAIGLSRRQLRLTLAIEGVLIAGVGAVIGSVLGLLYGWAGAATVLGTIGDVTLSVPWRDLGLVLLVAVVAGLLASILPGRSAANTSPVEALAVD